LASAGALRVLIDRILPLRDAAAAHRLVETNEPLGKVILDPTLEPSRLKEESDAALPQ